MKIKGSVTVFLSLSLSSFLMLTITLVCLLIQNSEKVRFAGSFDIAMNSVLGEYSKALADKYDLFYVDTSYLEGEPSLEKLKDHIRFYLQKNAVDVYEEKNGPWGCISLSAIEVNEVGRATASGGNSLRHQASEALKRMPDGETDRGEILEASYSDIIFDSTENPLESFNSVMATVESLKKPTRIDEETNEEKEIELVNPAQEIYEKSSMNILQAAGIDISKIRDVNIDTGDLCSNRNHIEGENACNSINNYEESAADEKREFATYVLSKFGNYQNQYSDHRLSCEIEYMINHDNNDLSNLEGVVNRIFVQKFANNLSLALSDENLRTQATQVALALEICLLSPEFTEPVTLCLLFAAAYQETISDLHSIMNGGRVCPIKTSHKMSIARVLSGQLYYDESDEGWTYEQYLLAMLYGLSDEEWNERVMDIMELEIRKDSQNPLFTMEGCLERINVTVTGEGRGGNSLKMQRIYGIY